MCKLVLNSRQDTLYINSLLSELYNLQAVHPELFRRAEFRVSERNHGDKVRFQKFFNLRGPDDDTAAIIRQSTDYAWFARNVWDCSARSLLTGSPNAQAHLLSMYLRAGRDVA